jgi:hypothetical protein
LQASFLNLDPAGFSSFTVSIPGEEVTESLLSIKQQRAFGRVFVEGVSPHADKGRMSTHVLLVCSVIKETSMTLDNPAYSYSWLHAD